MRWRARTTLSPCSRSSMPTSDACRIGPAVAVALSLGMGLFVAARPASGSPAFPGVVQSTLNMPCAPPCTLCHRDLNGGLGTVVQPFGKAMIAHDAEATNQDSVRSALAALEADAVDSDGDGVPDISELERGQNPNVKGDAGLCGPTYGCGAHVAPARHLDGFAAIAGAITALALAGAARRRRRRKRVHPR